MLYYYAVMAGAVAGVIISPLWHRAKIMQYANNTDDDNSMLIIATPITYIVTLCLTW